MRLTFLLRQLDTGGAERQVIELIRRLDPAAFDITLLTFYRGGQFAERLGDRPNVKSVCIEKSGRWDVLRFLWRLARAVRRANPDVIHSYLPLANILAVVLRLVVPRVKVVWGMRGTQNDLGDFSAGDRAVLAVETALSSHPDLIIFNSEAGREQYVAKGFPRATTLVVPNGVDVSVFRAGVSGEAIRRSWGSTSGDAVFGNVARITPMKDQLTFVRAAARVREKVPNARFLIIGPELDRDYTARVREEARRLGLLDAVTFTGGVEATAETYAALDVFVSSSAYGEGFSNAAAEALACGVRCVVTDVGDSGKIVGPFGLVVAPRDPEALAEAMTQALAMDFDPREAARSVAERYGTERLAQRTADALTRLTDTAAHSAG